MRKKQRDSVYKTTFSSPKQEHLLIVEVTVLVQPHALNTTLLVLMMHRMDGGRKGRDQQRTESVDVDGRIGLCTPANPSPTFSFPSSAQKVHLSFHIHLKRFF